MRPTLSERARDLRTAAPQGLLCRRCPKPEGAIALTAADRAALVAFDRTPPAALAVDAAAVRPGGALDALLRGALQAFAERSFRTYRHLRALRSVTS